MVSLFSCLFAAVVPTMNIVNFVRGSEPRNAAIDLVEPLREEIALNSKHHLPNTILFQYDALLREDMMAEARKAEQDVTEFGVWIEMCRALVEKVGIKWRGRNGWDWDWYINPGFLMAYTHEERAKILDEIFRLFRERFGKHPESMGSWLLDAWSMDYVQRKYDVKAFCICREQDNTDAYGLRGGFFNGAYYPSKRNMLSAAVDMRNAVLVPCFKMLTPDPIYNYSEESLATEFGRKTGSAYTLEPVGRFGQRREIIDWYFRIYGGPGLLNLSSMQTGQENSFGWPRIGKGLPYQIEKIAAERAAGRLVVEQLCETGVRFKRTYRTTPPQTQVALEDWYGKGNQSVWYNSRYYRANLVNENGKLYIRDIHVMKDDFAEPFVDTVCTGWQAEYFTPPVVDLYLANRKESKGPIVYEGKFAPLEIESAKDNELVVKAVRADARERVRFVFREDSVTVACKGQQKIDFTGFKYGRNELTFRGYDYSVRVEPMCDAVRMSFK